jgi:hypothetical protein
VVPGLVIDDSSRPQESNIILSGVATRPPVLDDCVAEFNFWETVDAPGCFGLADAIQVVECAASEAEATPSLAGDFEDFACALDSLSRREVPSGGSLIEDVACALDEKEPPIAFVGGGGVFLEDVAGVFVGDGVDPDDMRRLAATSDAFPFPPAPICDDVPGPAKDQVSAFSSTRNAFARPLDLEKRSLRSLIPHRHRHEIRTILHAGVPRFKPARGRHSFFGWSASASPPVPCDL